MKHIYQRCNKNELASIFFVTPCFGKVVSLHQCKIVIHEDQPSNIGLCISPPTVGNQASTSKRCQHVAQVT